jgi:hypothetical protein
MTPEAHALIVDLFERLRRAEAKARDPEAERLVRDLTDRQPSSPYMLAETVLAQEQALLAARACITELERGVLAARVGAGSLRSALSAAAGAVGNALRFEQGREMPNGVDPDQPSLFGDPRERR